MNKQKFLNVSIVATSMILFASGLTTSVSAKNRLSIIKVGKTVCPVYGIANFHTVYSGNTHQITFTGTASGFKTLTIKYGNKVVKSIKIKKNGEKFKVNVSFKGYNTFKIYGDKKILKTVTSSKYATKKPNIYSYDQSEDNLKIQLYGKKGDIIIVWKNGQPINRQKVVSSELTTLTVENSAFDDNAKVVITEHKLGKKTSRGIQLSKLDIGENVTMN
ncbi:hypothetical protein GYM70_00115 [Lactobacillus panisapium]|uniref:hypothetical protein n=1 Tax=Lactobacillus panisapium TaxID=2012495 RepID=UPI001C69C493|nr:hypothetical protein [Lactobacillus panisapium]QYN53896.1 hypothetical protein GYM70_00115 [Lactobacillus panisapium]